MSSTIHTEHTFESAIIAYLCANGRTEGTAANFDSELALAGKLRFILPKGIGEVELVDQVSEQQIRDGIEFLFSPVGANSGIRNAT